MKQKFVVIFAIILLLISGAIIFSKFVSSAQPTQQSNKILLNPFYRVGMTNNQNYSYSISINPPDGITKVNSAILSFDVYLNPSVNFTLWANGKTCNTQFFYVSTTYGSAGQARISFDCSNVINQSGEYNIILRPSGANTGSVNGWLDLTYMNKPLGTTDIFGTEYVEGDDGTLFLLLKDADGLPIENATCSVDIYYPNTINQTHPEWIDNGLMLYKEEGLYYYDFTAPLLTGLYMVNAQCSYLTQNNFYYTLASGKSPTRMNITTGTYTGDTFVLNDYAEWLYTQCDSSGGATKSCDSALQWNISNSNSYNVTQLYNVFLGENTITATMAQYWWNWTNNSWVLLPNNLTFKATASGSVPSGVDEYVSNSIPLTAIGTGSNLGLVRIRYYTYAGSTFKQFNNWISLKTSASTTQIQDIKGSGEIHISSAPAGINRFFKTISCDGFLDGRCAEATNDGEFDLVEGELEEIINISATSTKQNVSINYESPFAVDCTALYWVKEWNGTDWVDFEDYTTYSQTSQQNCIITLNKDIVSGSEYDFWFKFDNYMKWEVDWVKRMSDTVNKSVEPLCKDRGFTYINPIVDGTPISNDSITDFCHQFYDDQYWLNSYYDDSQLITNAGEYSSYLQEMRFYEALLLDKYTFLTAGDNTNLTALYYASIINASNINVNVNTSSIAFDVWNYALREVNASTGKLWVGGTEYSTTEDTGRIIARIISNSGEPVLGATCSIYIYQPSFPANMSAYSSGTMLGGGNITGGGQGVYYYDFPLNGEIGVHSYGINCSKLGQNYYLLGTFHIFGNNLTAISEAVWNSTNRSLTEFNFDVVNETNITENVWNYSGNVSQGILSQFASSIWNWMGSISNNIGDFFSNKIWTRTDRNLTYYEDKTDYTKIGEFVWNNTQRNLTYFPAQQDLTNYSLIQDLVTQFGNNDVTNYTLIQQMITLYGNNDMTNYTLMQYLISQFGNNDNTNYTLMQDLITQYGNNDTVNYTLVQDLITQFGNDDVTNYTYIGNLVAQFGNNNTDLTNYTAIQNLISQYGNVDSTNYSLMTDLMMQFANNDSTNYSAIQNLITQYGNTDTANYTLIQYLVSQYGNNDVTNYTLMQDLITQYGNTDTVNYTLVEELVSQYSTNYTLMQNLISQYGNNDMTNYTLIQELITQFGNNQNQTDLTNYTAIQDLITQYGNTDTANYTLIQYLVSQYGNNDNTNYTLMTDLITQYGNTDNVNYTLVQNLISQYGNLDMTDYNKIGEFVWNWTSRELTGLNLTVNATINSTQLANDIWSWSNRSLTFYADMTNYTKINIGVWTYNNRTLFFLYGNGTGGSVNPPSGKLPLTNIEIVLPDPFYFDTTYTIYYDPVDIKGATVDVRNVSVKIIENITYTLTTPVIMTDGRYEQELTIPYQEVNSITLDVNMTQGYIITNQKAFIIPEEKRAGITGFAIGMDDKTKRNLLYLGIFFLFILFIYVLIAVATKSKKEKKSNGYSRY